MLFCMIDDEDTASFGIEQFFCNMYVEFEETLGMGAIRRFCYEIVFCTQPIKLKSKLV